MTALLAATRSKSYPPTWDGDLLLACRKCQKKLKGEPGMRARAKLRKTIKPQNKEHPNAARHLISVPCMDMRPKSAVTICLPSAQTARLSILHKEDEIDGLYRERSTSKQMQDIRCSPLY